MNPQKPTSEPLEDRRDFHPGQTISPHEPEAEQAPVVEPRPETHVQAPAEAAAPAPIPPAANTETPEERSFFRPDPAQEAAPAPQTDESPNPASAQAYEQSQEAAPRPVDNGPVSWTASEYVEHEKNQMWYIQLGAAGFVLGLIVYLITRDFISTGAVLVAVALFGVVGSRPPRQLQYVVDGHGLTIGEKQYPYSDFRSFSVYVDGGLHSITFMPLKRFAPPISIYYDPADEDRIAGVLASHLPLENHKADPIEKLMRKIRF